MIVSCKGNKSEVSPNHQDLIQPIVNNLDSAILLAQKHSKEILLLFDCYNCLGTRQNHMDIFEQPEVKSKIDKKYVFLILYLDDKTKLKDNDSGNTTTIDELNNEIQRSIMEMNNIPALIIIDNQKNIIKGPIFLPLDRKNITEFLGCN